MAIIMPEQLRTILVAITFSSVVFGQNICNRFEPVAGRCDLNAPAKAQALCLLRPVQKFGNLGQPLPSLPAPLDTIVGEPTALSFTLQQVKDFLTQKGIAEGDVGGSLSISLSATTYFVIHDTSDFSEATEFAANINDETAGINRLAGRLNHKVCHVYVNRAGQSATAIVFESPTPPNGTKFGRCNSNQRSAFLHIENIQPRIRDRSVRFQNDAIAPTPGFTDAQLERLALLYIVASARSGRWLIPAYHSPIDLGFPDRHDDPQNFDLQTWATKLVSMIAQVRAVR
jgi:hypothetical protein